MYFFSTNTWKYMRCLRFKGDCFLRSYATAKTKKTQSKRHPLLVIVNQDVTFIKLIERQVFYVE